MGKVEFGAFEENGKWVPTISVSGILPEPIVYTANIEVSGDEAAFEISKAVYAALSAPQLGLRVDEKGNARQD